MDIEDDIGPKDQRLFRLVRWLEELANDALRKQKLNPEDRADLEDAAKDIERIFSLLAHEVIEPLRREKPERVEFAYELLLRFVSTVVIIIDPERNKAGIAAAINQKPPAKLVV